MGILYNKESKIFTLNTKDTTYQMQVDAYGFLLHLYYGKQTEGCMDYLLTYHDRGFSGNPYDVGNDRTYSMDVLPQEFPCQGTGDYRNHALRVQNSDGSYSCDLRYKSYEIYKGKYHLKGLPAVYANEAEAESLEIVMEDCVTKLQVILLYGVLPKHNVITRSAKVVNAGNAVCYLEKIASACLDFIHGSYDFISFYGCHAMERNFQRASVVHGAQVIESRRGTSSHQYNPLMILADSQTTEDCGDCYGISLLYSGGFRGQVEMDQFNQTRVVLGIQDEMFRYPLQPGETFYAPEAALIYTHNGLNQLSQNYHACYKEHLCRGKYKNQVRPILLNSWEAQYFDFNGNDIYELAKQAAEVGIEMLVLDDGWFGKRDSDNSGLGDWYVNEEKLGGTLNHLVTRINALGIRFGIWIEPEMVSEDSDLYREHQDWTLMIPGRNPVRARNQLVLDFSRKEVVDYIYEQICDVLDQGNIEYVKWDMNRSISDVYSTMTNEQGRVMHDYVLGLYSFMERLIKRYPNILIEGCSGGGGRFDAGMLYYTPQIWCSDNTDAIDRVKIQYGTSFGYPISAVGSHVSAVPNHQTGREVSLKTRGVVAMAGTFGYELDVKALSESEKEEIRQQIASYHKYAELIQNGTYYRLTNPFEEEVGAWEFVSGDGSEALLNVVSLAIHASMAVPYIKLRGLSEEAVYEDVETRKTYRGSALMAAGLPMLMVSDQYQAQQIHLKRC